jgi:hypothetical protein
LNSFFGYSASKEKIMNRRLVLMLKTGLFGLALMVSLSCSLFVRESQPIASPQPQATNIPNPIEPPEIDFPATEQASSTNSEQGLLEVDYLCHPD